LVVKNGGMGTTIAIIHGRGARAAMVCTAASDASPRKLVAITVTW